MESNRTVLTTHVRPDGDGIASELALFQILKSLGREVHIINHDPVPEIYEWLPFSDIIKSTRGGNVPLLDSIDLSVLLDCASENRIGSACEVIRNSRDIVSIDHHEGNECFRDYCYIDTSASSIGEILYSLVPDIKRLLDRDLATCLYVSIMTDTGSFAYSNTTPAVFRIVSELIEYGLAPDEIYKNIYNHKRIGHFRLLGKALERMERDESGRVVSVLLPLKLYRESGAVEEDNEGILEVIRGLGGIELIILLRQIDETMLKCSLRSVNSIDCSHLARLFDGGGHFKAAGFVLKGDVEKTGKSIVEKILREVKECGWL
ncbi:MAG: bifunctional oligoribonuclease/PAP phosphatase NrnA [Spirochaetes bacterium]|nr:bifunctional oligoribonuclease/PAP phosphatase NrnA [Spirochaetota bacterium]